MNRSFSLVTLILVAAVSALMGMVATITYKDATKIALLKAAPSFTTEVMFVSGVEYHIGAHAVMDGHVKAMIYAAPNMQGPVEIVTNRPDFVAKPKGSRFKIYGNTIEWTYIPPMVNLETYQGPEISKKT
jgi:hypothetical protein